MKTVLEGNDAFEDPPGCGGIDSGDFSKSKKIIFSQIAFFSMQCESSFFRIFREDHIDRQKIIGGRQDKVPFAACFFPEREIFEMHVRVPCHKTEEKTAV